MGIASAMDRRVQFRRATDTADDYGGFTRIWDDHGAVIWCLRQDVRDTEAVTAGVFGARLMSRFSVRSTEFTRALTAADRLICEGEEFEIAGIKQAQTGQRRQLIEITGVSAID
ncbi:MAG: phage head-tail adapter protein [Rhodobacteraceae bacterium]|nr:phage head-tail adapter protein [Paracoccaceae bacterium]MBR26156.1 phage head-tail adapter protein [Paracoccaceae bacterium]